MWQRLIYEFAIRAVSPVRCGANETEVVKTPDGKPVILGNSLGGALRAYLQQGGVRTEDIEKAMGGEVESAEEKKKFLPSRIYISDGMIENYSDGEKQGLPRQEGTAVNPVYGAAEPHQKYMLEYLPAGTTVNFKIESDVWAGAGKEHNDALQPAELEKLVATWANGFAGGQLLLGGQKSNGFGRFTLDSLQARVVFLDNSQALDRYIFGSREKPAMEDVPWQAMPQYPLVPQCAVTFTLQGVFPYGVYQAFPVTADAGAQAAGARREPLTGLLKKRDNKDNGKHKEGQEQAYYIPAASLKGVLRHEVLRLLGRMMSDTADQGCGKNLTDLFGGTGSPGKLTVHDIVVTGTPVAVNRDSRQTDLPIYIKIDRLTGSSYDSALKRQQEIQGTAVISLELAVKPADDGYLNYIFPLVYVLRRLGAGLIPLGGRTVAGLGQFLAPTVNIGAGEETWQIETGPELSTGNRRQLEMWWESFAGWCRQ
ncbi:RAMP superfamily CRISPR-associated protein [Sporomusa termitida]|uniref:CRISPR-associated RAMP protein n=1 Tax=Sporomusa termitida TaxID=2377 RepID=A0A517DNI0_9FIRM|nr:RAMP superfamily CRISPR-associated protein [Sporomusa termitida]QDR78924.1 CRISPR-associated RAMP protein [Sporomusa termitida]